VRAPASGAAPDVHVALADEELTIDVHHEAVADPSATAHTGRFCNGSRV
jgi:hypothetical protein